MYYASKRAIVTIETMNEDFTLDNMGGTDYGFAGDIIATDMNGNKKVLPKAYFEECFVGVDVKETKYTVVKRQPSPFVEQFTEAMMTTYNGSQIHPEEDEHYIKGSEQGWETEDVKGKIK